MGMAQERCQTGHVNLAPFQRAARRMRDRRPVHRRRGGGGNGGGKIPQGRRGRVAHGDALLVLWQETMDMDASVPKAIWGFNGTERPGAVYLAAVSAGAHPERPARFRNLRTRRAGHWRLRESQADVQGKLFRFVNAGLAVATMRGK